MDSPVSNRHTAANRQTTNDKPQIKKQEAMASRYSADGHP